MISMVGIANENGANQQTCYKHPLRTKGKVHFEPGFGGRPWVFGGEVEHSSPALAAKIALAVVGVGRVTASFGRDPTEAEAQPSIVVCVDGYEGRAEFANGYC